VTVGEAHVWRVPLGDGVVVPAPTAGEAKRAARFKFERHRKQYLRSHGALRAILGRLTEARLDFALTPSGKPFLPGAPQLKFNLSHSGEMALVGAALDVDIGVDVEHVRTVSDYRELAERFFPASEAAELRDEGDFFRRWTRIESVIKATGAGLYGMGVELSGEWTIEEIDAGPGYSAAVALPKAGMRIVLHDFGGSE
jgi:4'-phosphopantetheinyl transferase